MPTDTDTTDTDTADTATATADTATATADTATATATATAIPTTPRVNRKVCQKCGAECERRFWVHTSADNHSHRELWCSSRALTPIRHSDGLAV
jgi:NMD protein affecting ribosome stability and mRNA decay